MFNLTCPSCSNQTKVRFARMGATATCPKCRHQYKVDGHTLVVVEDDESSSASTPPPQEEGTSLDAAAAMAAAGQEEVTESPTPAPTTSKNEPPPPPDFESDDMENIPVAAPARSQIDDSSMSTPVASRSVPSEVEDELPVAGPRTNLDPRMSPDPTATGAYRKGIQPLHMALAGGAVVLLIVVVLVVVLSGGGDDVTVAGSNGSGSGGGNDTTQNDPPGGNNGGSSSQSSGSSGSGNGSDNPDNPDRPPDPPKFVDPASELPAMLLDEVSAVNYNWVPVNPPVEPSVSPTFGSDVVLWSTAVQNFPAGSALIVQHLSDNPIVNGSAFMHVQLLNAEKKVYAELQSKVPILCGKQGLRFGVPIPPAIMRNYDSHVATLVPVEPLSDAVALEAIESRFRRIATDSGSPEAVRVVMKNPTGRTLISPTVVVELLGAQGYPLGTWRGGVDTSVEPGDTLAFQIKLMKPIPRPTHVFIRGYAFPLN